MDEDGRAAELRRRLWTTDQVSMLEPTRETARRRHPNYRLRGHVITTLGPAVTYRRRTSDEYDRKLVELLRETGRIIARMVRIALDLDAAAASRVLADLVERELLVKTADAQRAPSVTYDPGAQFPASPARALSVDEHADGRPPRASPRTTKDSSTLRGRPSSG